MNVWAQLAGRRGLALMGSLACLLASCSARQTPVRTVTVASSAQVPDALTRYLAAPVVVLVSDVTSMASLDAASAHIDVAQARIRKVYRDAVGEASERGTILIARRDQVLANADGTVQAIVRDAAQHRLDEKPFAVLYLHRDEALGVFVPLAGTWSVTPVASLDDGDRVAADIDKRIRRRPGTTGSVERAAFALRAAPDGADYDAYLGALVSCPAFTYETLLAAQRSGTPADFHHWASRCERRGRVRTL